MANKLAYEVTALTGGTTSALDGIDGAVLNDGDFAFAFVANVAYFYVLDATSGLTESSPDVIAPDSTAGTKRWILQSAFSNPDVGGDFTSSQQLHGDALLWRFKDTGTSGVEWGIRSDGGYFQLCKNTGTEETPTWTIQTIISLNSIQVGDNTNTDKVIYARNGMANLPALRYYSTGSKWQYSNDGTSWYDIGSGTGGGSGASVEKELTITGHGFVVGDCLYYNGTSYVKAIASNAASADVVGIVNGVVSDDAISLLATGYVSGLTGLVAGSTYFLSPTTAGALTITEPTTPGTISKPLLIAISATEGYFFNWRGLENTDMDDADSPYIGIYYTNLAISYATGNTATVTADEVILVTANNKAKMYTNLSETVNMTSSGANGLETGSTRTVSTWYHIWAIGKIDGTLDCLISASSSNPTVPSGYDYKLYLGSVYNDATNTLDPMKQINNNIMLPATDVVTNGQLLVYTEQSLGAVIPPTAKGIMGVVKVYTASPCISASCDISPSSDGAYGNINVSWKFTNVGGEHIKVPFSMPLLPSPIPKLYWKTTTTGVNVTQATITINGYWY